MNPDIYKERYEFEWNHRSHLLEVTNICIAAATIVGSGLVIEAQAFDYESKYKTLFLSILAADTFFLSMALYFIARSIVGYGYSHIATPNQMYKHYEALIEWCGINGKPESEAVILFQKFANEKLGEAVDINIENNRKKSAYNQKSIIAVFLSLLLLFVLTIPFLISTTSEENHIHKVKVVSPLIFEKEDSKMTTPPSQTNTPPQAPTVKPETPIPSGPQNIIIKEHREKPQPPPSPNKK